MGLKVTRKLPAFQGVSTGTAFTASIQIPIGLSIENMFIAFSGDITLAKMTNLVVEANGKELMNFRTGTELDRFNQFEGRAAASTILTIDFTRFGLRTREGEELTKLGTGMPFNNQLVLANGQSNPAYNPFPISSLTFRMDVTACTVVSLSGFYTGSNPTPTGLVRKVRRFDPAAAIAGENTISEIPKGDDINSVFFWKTDIINLAIERDSYRVFDRTVALNNLIQLDGVKTPIASAFVFAPTEMGNAAESLTTAGVADLRFIPNVSFAGNIPITVDFIGKLTA